MDKELKQTLEKIEQKFGEGTIVGGIQKKKYEVVSTGSLGLDMATGIGGLALGSVVEIMGWEMAGKSTVTLNVIANAQKMGKRCLLVDGENSFSEKYAKALGVKVEDLLVNQIDSEGGEKCYNVAEYLIRSGQVGVVVFDSQTSLVPKRVMEDEVGTAALGLHARMLSSSIPKFVTLSAKHNCLVVYVSQYREKIGVMYGSPVTTNGGNALKFYSHMRIEISKSVQKVDNIAHHNKTKCKVVKNKMAPPYKEAEFDIIFGEGIDKFGELVDVGSDLEIIERKGSWFSYKGDKLGQGRDTVKTLLSDNEGLYNEIYSKVIERRQGIISKIVVEK